jgi:hypothetical protein
MAARRCLVAAALALVWLGAAALPGRPSAVDAVNPWQVAVSPTVLTEGVPTDVSVTVTDGSETIGCFVLDLPAGFTVVGASVSSVPSGDVWSAVVAGSGPTRVTFGTTTNPWRLSGGAQGVFDVSVIATASPLPAWTATAYKSFTVDSTQLAGGPLVAPGAFTILPAPTPTPISTPAPTDTPGPSPGPTGTPTAAPTAANSGPIVSAPPEPTQTASPSASASTGPIAGGSAAPTLARPSVVAPAAGDGTSLDVGALPAGGTVQLDNQAVGGIGMFAWIVPGLFLSLPGLLLLFIVLAQGSLATVFVPVTRRVLGRYPRQR